METFELNFTVTLPTAETFLALLSVYWLIGIYFVIVIVARGMTQRPNHWKYVLVHNSFFALTKATLIAGLGWPYLVILGLIERIKNK